MLEAETTDLMVQVQRPTVAEMAARSSKIVRAFMFSVQEKWANTSDDDFVPAIVEDTGRVSAPGVRRKHPARLRWGTVIKGRAQNLVFGAGI